MRTLRAMLLEVLREGGARKPAILQALAKSKGFTQQQFRTTVASLKRNGQLKLTHRNGGPHYAAVGST